LRQAAPAASIIRTAAGSRSCSPLICHDNFEWAEGYGPKFGLYRVDRATFARTPSEAVPVYAGIVQARALSSAERAQRGGSGPLPPEPGIPADPATCTRDGLGR
jgi:hypothetical protein